MLLAIQQEMSELLDKQVYGPLYIKQCSDASHQQTEKKVWVCLCTCLVVRVVHLEIVEDMSTDQFLLGLRRFMARRGAPRQIISDNAKQFKLARKVLNKAHQEAILHDKLKDYVAGRGIQWTPCTLDGWFLRTFGGDHHTDPPEDTWCKLSYPKSVNHHFN